MHERAGTPAHRHFRLALCPWRGDFYPEGLRQKDELRFASRAVNSIEINGTFYALQTPERFRGWAEDTPRTSFSASRPRVTSPTCGACARSTSRWRTSSPPAPRPAPAPRPVPLAVPAEHALRPRAVRRFPRPPAARRRRRAEARPAQRRAPAPRGATSTAIRRSACGMPWKSAMRLRRPDVHRAAARIPGCPGGGRYRRQVAAARRRLRRLPLPAPAWRQGTVPQRLLGSGPGPVAGTDPRLGRRRPDRRPAPGQPGRPGDGDGARPVLATSTTTSRCAHPTTPGASCSCWNSTAACARCPDSCPMTCGRVPHDPAAPAGADGEHPQGFQPVQSALHPAGVARSGAQRRCRPGVPPGGPRLP